jgi:hypothetical protein
MATKRNNEAFATRVVLETVWDEICHNAQQSRELVQTKLLADGSFAKPTVSVQSMPMFSQCRCNTTSWPHKDEAASPPTMVIITGV